MQKNKNEVISCPKCNGRGDDCNDNYCGFCYGHGVARADWIAWRAKHRERIKYYESLRDRVLHSMTTTLVMWCQRKALEASGPEPDMD